MRLGNSTRTVTRRWHLLGVLAPAAAALAFGATLVAGAGTAVAVTNFPPTGTTISPGASLLFPASSNGTTSSSNQCTGDFIFTGGGNTYIGTAAHCAEASSGTTPSTDAGCDTTLISSAGSGDPIGLPVYLGEPPVSDNSGSVPAGVPVSQGPQIGTLAYDSWYTMQQLGYNAATSGPEDTACQYNDFALVQLLPGVTVSDTVPLWGGPDGLDTTGASEGSAVYTYGNSGLRGSAYVLSPMPGVSEGYVSGSGNWTEQILTDAVPGDSGSPVLDSGGNALGVLVTLQAGTSVDGVSVGVTDLDAALSWLGANSGLPAISLATSDTFSAP
ncbi:MAG TPA: trypsin-like serine protease [Acidimicrobiales bacterium]|nr:trypsin-like serine protease [Acidimicrobiales bacterium]